MNRFSRFASAALLAVAWIAAPVSAAEIQGKTMTLPSTERQVKVTYFRAPGDAKRPSVLLLHGAGGFDRRIAEYNHYASVLANAGIDAYLFYYYNEQDEKMMSFGVDVFSQRYEAWAKQVDDVADYLLKQKDSNGKVGLVGFSNGGILTSGASSLDTKINAAVVYYGTDPWPLPREPEHYPPLLILHGDADQVIPVEEGKQLAAEAKLTGAKVDLVIYPGEMHGFGSDTTKKNGADALNRTVTFLKRELLGK